MFELVENRLFPYADDSILLAVACKTADDLLLLHPFTGTWLESIEMVWA